MIHNRVRRDRFETCQEFMAQMLGVHRPTVSVAANILQKAGLIRYSRGQMEILDSEGLREGACECYEIVAAAMQTAGLIQYHRGSMTIRDRAGLEAASCECYRVIQAEFARLMT